MEPIDQLDDIAAYDLFETYTQSWDFRLMMLTEYLETALLLMLVACVWAIYRHISKKALLPLIFAACALSLKLTLDFIFQMTNLVLDIEQGSYAFTALEWSSHTMYLLACISMIMLIANGVMSQEFSRMGRDKTSQ